MFIRKTVHGYSAVLPSVDCQSSRWVWRWECGTLGRPARAEWFFLRGAGLVTGLLLYPAALQLYHNGFTYVFVDFATGACCLLLILGVAGFLARLSGPAQVFALIGTYSYGIFLTHQPYVIWLGLRIREQPMWLFPFIAVATLAVVSAWGIVLEKATNALLQMLGTGKPKPRLA